MGRHDLAHVQIGDMDLRPDTIGETAGFPSVSIENARNVEANQEDTHAEMAQEMETRPNNLYILPLRNEETVLATGTGGFVASNSRKSTQLDSVRRARLQGYEGDACGECGNFTMVRNGTCLKCNTCGATSGCS